MIGHNDSDAIDFPNKDTEGRTYSSAEDALKVLGPDYPGIVISDIKMPGVDGLKLLELLSENLPEIPVIIMTAYSDFETTITSYKKGAFEYLAKPFDIDQVLVMVKQARRNVDATRVS